MRNILVILLLLVIAGSCKKKDNTRPFTVNGRSFINGVQTNVEVNMLIRMGEQKSDFSIRTDNLSGLYTSYPIISSTIGIYSVPNSTVYTQQEPSYPDYPCERYGLVVSDTRNNYIEITKYNSTDNSMSGKFGFTVVKIKSNCNRVMPDTIKFTSGTFENVVIYDQNK